MPFKDTPDGQTNYCPHETKNLNGVCDRCLGKNNMRNKPCGNCHEDHKGRSFCTKYKEGFCKDYPVGDIKRKFVKK